MSHSRPRIVRWISSFLVLGILFAYAYAVWWDFSMWQFKVVEFFQHNPLRGVFVMIGFFLVILWGIPKWQVIGVTDFRARLALETDARMTLAHILGGMLFFAALYVIWSTLYDMRNALEVSQKVLQVSRQEDLSERFTRAIDQLGAVHVGGQGKKLEVRLGGIYALEWIAQESPQDYWPIMEILTAYARANPSLSDPPAVDLEAVLTVLKRRKNSYGQGEEQPLNLRALGFRGAPLEGMNLHGADLTKADLQEADLSRTDLSGANLQKADLSGANLQEADLSGANLQEANLSGVDLTKATLAGTSFKGARLNDASLKGIDLTGISLVGTSLYGTDLRGANLAGANLAGNSLSGANLQEANLQEANLQEANLAKANLQEANLAKANLRGANLQETNLARAALQETNLREASLTDVRNLAQKQFNQACTDDRRPKWPFNLTWPGDLTPSPSLQETCKRWNTNP